MHTYPPGMDSGRDTLVEYACGYQISSAARAKSFCLFVCLFVNRPPGSHLLCQQTMTPQTFCPGGCIMFCLSARVAGCPRRLPNKKLTKSYTRYPVVGAWRPRSPLSVTRTSCPRSIHGRSAPDPGLYCAQRLLHSSIALNGRRGSPPFQGLGW